MKVHLKITIKIPIKSDNISHWHGAKNVRHCPENVRHGAKKVWQGAKNVQRGAEIVMHCV